MMEIQVIVATSVIGLFVGIFFYIMKIFKDASLQEKDKISNISLAENEFEEPPEKPRRKSENVSNCLTARVSEDSFTEDSQKIKLCRKL